MMVCHDLRSRSATDLPSILESLWVESPRGLLAVSHRPHKKWTAALTFAHPLIFSSSALYELILWAPKDLDLNLSDEVALEQRRLLDDYRDIFKPEDRSLQRQALKLYTDQIHQHIARDESNFYPLLLERIPVERALKELSYEHRGLEKGLQDISKSLEDRPHEKLTAKERERLDLNFYHLLEHHLERERNALYPAWKILSKKG